jgi:hypothetical protein
MRVIKKGSENTDWGKDLTCKGNGLGKGVGGCGAILHVTPADIARHTDSDGDSSYWFVCPECSAKTYVNHNTFK